MCVGLADLDEVLLVPASHLAHTREKSTERGEGQQITALSRRPVAENNKVQRKVVWELIYALRFPALFPLIRARLIDLLHTLINISLVLSISLSCSLTLSS